MGKRVAAIGFLHESNTFSCIPTGMDAFRSNLYALGDQIARDMRGTNTEIGGYFDAATRYGWTPALIAVAHAQPGGIVTEAARQIVADETQARLRAAGPLDGVFVALHGAMVTESSQDGESQFLRLIREVVGPDIPIAVTFDLHGNIFDEIADLAQIAVSFRTYPHVDMAETGEAACDLLDRAMQGSVDPALHIARPPMMTGCDEGRTTGNGPMCKLLESADRLAMQEGILSISLNAGFPEADVFATGPSAIVCYDKSRAGKAVAKQIADEITNEIWGWRDVQMKPIPLDNALIQLDKTPPGSGPVVIADYADNPGSGAYGDCTNILAALLVRGVENAAFGTILDPEAAAELVRIGVGATATLQLGGKTDARVGGGPISVTGTVKSITDGRFIFEGPMFAGLPGNLGPSACLIVGGMDILVVSERVQPHDKNIFRVLGIEPAETSILVVKSMQHFRSAFADIAREIIVTDAGGLSTMDHKNRTYRNLRRPVWPLDEDADFITELPV